MEHCPFTSTPRPTATALSPPASPPSCGPLASVIALRGLSLRPVINKPAPTTPQVNIYPAFHFPPQPTPDHDDPDDEPDNVHPLQR
ncbi:hypothetical protein GCM10017687_65870 [Streptomyces echinatus]